MTVIDLLKQQSELQERAHLVLDELNLLGQLEAYGPTKIVGSLTLGLMAWPDIDIETYVDVYNLDNLREIASILLANKRIIEVTLRDYRLDPNPNKPKGMYVGAKYNLNNEKWKLDIWLLKPEHKQQVDITQKMDAISDDQRASILNIKHQVWNHAGYRKKFSSIDIYTAVLDFDVNEIEGFNNYLQKTNRQL